MVSMHFKAKAHDVARYCLYSVIKIDKMTSQFYVANQNDTHIVMNSVIRLGGVPNIPPT